MNVTLWIIVATGITTYMAWQKPELMKSWIFNAYYIKRQNQWYRLLTSGFIHKDWMHVIFNMFTLYFLGTGVESALFYFYGTMGLILYVGLYISAIVISSIPSFIKHRDHIYYNSLGASGGVSAVVFAFILLNPTQNLYLMALIPIPGFIVGTLYLIYTYQMSKKKMDYINHDAHLWGAIYGLVFLLIVEPRFFLWFVEEVSKFGW